ncbi:MAG UNVERIFIED_CONTAM: hypothetical protein LVQ98_00335 [Rickettsiaceae bacterium]
MGGCKEIEKSQEVEYVINLQGDLPLVSPKIISTIAEALLTTDADIITPVTKDPAEKVNNPARVKVIRGINDEALYFSRNMIPYGSDYYWHHIGIYGFKRDSLERFVKMPQSHTELSEKLEQLRALHNGMKIGLCDAVENVASVDTAEDLQFVRNLYHKLHQIV